MMTRDVFVPLSGIVDWLVQVRGYTGEIIWYFGGARVVKSLVYLPLMAKIGIYNPPGDCPSGRNWYLTSSGADKGKAAMRDAEHYHPLVTRQVKKI